MAVLLLLPVSLSAQWLDFPTPGIPRTADGKPNLTAPAPRTPDGKPDLSGIWQPEVNPYRFDLIQDLKDEAIFRPEDGFILQILYEVKTVGDRKSTRLNSSHVRISYAVFCLNKKKQHYI